MRSAPAGAALRDARSQRLDEHLAGLEGAADQPDREGALQARLLDHRRDLLAEQRRAALEELARDLVAGLGDAARVWTAKAAISPFVSGLE